MAAAERIRLVDLRPQARNRCSGSIQLAADFDEPLEDFREFVGGTVE